MPSAEEVISLWSEFAAVTPGRSSNLGESANLLGGSIPLAPIASADPDEGNMKSLASALLKDFMASAGGGL